MRDNIVTLERKIVQVSILAERYQNDRAIILIIKAKEEFQVAQRFLNEWIDLTRRPRPAEKLLAARAHYKLSNNLADQAARLLLFKPTANLKTELERLIHLAESAAHSGDNSELRYFLNKARAFHRQALSALSQSRYLTGHEYLKIAIYFAKKTIALARSNQNIDNRINKFEEQKNNIQVLLNQVAYSITDKPVLNELYQSAQNFLKRALAAYNDGKLKSAYSQLQITERLVYRIIDLSDNDNISFEDRLKDDYQSLGRYLNSVRNELESAGKKSKLLTRAENLYAKAGKNLSSGQFKKAAGNLKLSQRMGMRAFKKLSSDTHTDTENLKNRLNEIGHFIQLQGDRLNESNYNSLTSLYNQAVRFYNQAEQAYGNEQFPQTSYLLNLSLRILNRNEKLLQQKVEDKLSANKIKNDLLRTEQIFTRLKDNTSLKDKEKIKISYLSELVKKARTEFDKNNLVITRELLFITQQQLSTMLKN